MPDVMIVNVPPFDGEYEFDLEAQPFSTVEWRWIKQISGYLPLTIDEGWRGADPSLFLAFAVIAMKRSGKIAKADVLATAEVIEDAPTTGDQAAFTFKGEAVEEEELDPPQSSEPSDSKPDSGDDSAESTEPTPESETQEASGTPDSDTGLDSLRLTSVT